MTPKRVVLHIPGYTFDFFYCVALTGLIGNSAAKPSMLKRSTQLLLSTETGGVAASCEGVSTYLSWDTMCSASDNVMIEVRQCRTLAMQKSPKLYQPLSIISKSLCRQQSRVGFPHMAC